MKVKDLKKKPSTSDKWDGRTLVCMLIDESGSMSVRKDQTISAFNEYVASLQEQGEGEVSFSLTKFNTRPTVVCTDCPIEDVVALDTHNYQPNGCTALYDAIAITVNALDYRTANTKSRVLFVILTDGEENSSAEYNKTKIRQLIEMHEGRGNWTFVYMGSSESTWSDASGIGIFASNTFHWTPEKYGVTMRGLAGASLGYRACNAASTTDFAADIQSAINAADQTTGGGDNA